MGPLIQHSEILCSMISFLNLLLCLVGLGQHLCSGFSFSQFKTSKHFPSALHEFKYERKASLLIFTLSRRCYVQRKLLRECQSLSRPHIRILYPGFLSCFTSPLPVWISSVDAPLLLSPEEISSTADVLSPGGLECGQLMLTH